MGATPGGVLRIVGGRFGGRRLAPVPKDGVRPTADPVREALFNLLAPRIAGAAFVDLCAGTGAVGLEALSRGAAPVWFVENDRAALRTLRRNVDLLGIDLDQREVVIVEADVRVWLEKSAASQLPPQVDLVWLDPPYGDKRVARWLAALAGTGRLTPASLVILEHSRRDTPALDPFEVRWTRRYGDTCLTAAGLAGGA